MFCSSDNWMFGYYKRFIWRLLSKYLIPIYSFFIAWKIKKYKGGYKLKLAHWNIQGLTTEKLEDSSFIDQIKKHDIVILSETHLDNSQDIDITGYKCYKLCRSKTLKINRSFGGIAILYKSELQGGVTF